MTALILITSSTIAVLPYPPHPCHHPRPRASRSPSFEASRSSTRKMVMRRRRRGHRKSSAKDAPCTLTGQVNESEGSFSVRSPGHVTFCPVLQTMVLRSPYTICANLWRTAAFTWTDRDLD
eukprot:1557228-Rhodomonas_salina.1